MELQPLDYVLLAVAGGMAIVGFFKGFSGWLGTLAGAGAATVAGMLGFGLCREAVASCDFIAEAWQWSAAMALDFLGALIVFGLVRKVVAKFVGFLVPQPLNAFLGALGGLFLAAVAALFLAALLELVGTFLPEGSVSQHSVIVQVSTAVLTVALEGATP